CPLPDLRRPDRGTHVAPADEDARAAVLEAEVERGGDLREAATVFVRERRDVVRAVDARGQSSVVTRFERGRAVDRAGVEVDEAEAVGEGAAHRALPRPRGPVDRHDRTPAAHAPLPRSEASVARNSG